MRTATGIKEISEMNNKQQRRGGLLGSLGLMPSACIGPDKGYYEPSHGSAPSYWEWRSL